MKPSLDCNSRVSWHAGCGGKHSPRWLRMIKISFPIFSFSPLPGRIICTCFVWCLCWVSVAFPCGLFTRGSRGDGSVPIQTSPNCPFPRRLISCSDSRGISQTSLVLTDRSARRGIPLWQGTTKRQQSPAARSASGAQREHKHTQRRAQRVSQASCKK